MTGKVTLFPRALPSYVYLSSFRTMWEHIASYYSRPPLSHLTQSRLKSEAMSRSLDAPNYHLHTFYDLLATTFQQRGNDLRFFVLRHPHPQVSRSIRAAAVPQDTDLEIHRGSICTVWISHRIENHHARSYLFGSSSLHSASFLNQKLLEEGSLKDSRRLG